MPALLEAGYSLRMVGRRIVIRREHWAWEAGYCPSMPGRQIVIRREHWA